VIRSAEENIGKKQDGYNMMKEATGKGKGDGCHQYPY